MWFCLSHLIVISIFGNMPVSHTPPTASLFHDPSFGFSERLAPSLTNLLNRSGYTVVSLAASDLCVKSGITPDKFDWLVLADASHLPMASIVPIQQFLKKGGNILALNVPAWAERLVTIGESWQTLDKYREQKATETPSRVIIDFTQEPLYLWFRNAFRMATPTLYSIIPNYLAPGKAALEVSIPEFEGWDSVCRNFKQPPFDNSHIATVFSAKGEGITNRLAIEWREYDGSRWIAVVPLSRSWQQYVLLPEHFKFWESVPERANTRFNPANAAMLAFTLAYTHTGFLTGAHKFWVAQIGTASLDEIPQELHHDTLPPALELVSPAYKFFDMNDVATLAAAPGQTLVDHREYALPQTMLGMHPRPEGGGYDKKRPWRWIPLLEAQSGQGELRGCTAALMVHDTHEYNGGVWASFAINDEKWYLSADGQQVLSNVIASMGNPLFILDGGAQYYTYFEDQDIRLGATILHVGQDAVDGVTLSIEVLDFLENTVHTVSWSELFFPPKKRTPFETSWRPSQWPEEGYTVRTRLVQQGKIIDEVSHCIYAWQPKKDKSFVTIANGQFICNGQPWRPHGINYMPSSGIAVEWWKYFEHWLSAFAYHPRVIQRDLERCAAMGCNALSIFIYRESMEDQNLLDLLRRMDTLGMKANLSLRPGTPIDFPWNSVRELIEYYRLAENDTVFAYDLAWEPQFRDWERDPLNSEWQEWIIDRYGSLENAAADWGFPVPTDNQGNVINIQPNWLYEKGPWDRMVAAYRRFLDTLLYARYSKARQLVRSIDPNHWVSFRMSMAGDPTDRSGNTILYDFAYLAGAVDILEPEGYGRIGDWDRIKPGVFTHAYAQWANPNLPVLWAEAGVQVWDMSVMQPTLKNLVFQSTFYRNFYRMLMLGGADGIFWWWYPGGFRVNENSDYGVINPDGTDRPVTRVIREHAEKFATFATPPHEGHRLEFDRDQHNNGLTGIYESLQERFWEAMETGSIPELYTQGTGTDSTNCPPLAVGNTPWTGNNPPKYLDAFFDTVEIVGKDGNGLQIGAGQIIPIQKSSPTRMRITVTNLGEATWIPSHETAGNPGSVGIILDGDEKKILPIPTRVGRFAQVVIEADITSMISEKETLLTLRIEAEGRTRFGPTFQCQFVLEEADSIPVK